MVIVKRRGRYVCDYYQHGKRRRVSFKTKAEAEAHTKIRDEPKVDRLIGERISLKESIRRYFETVSSKKMPETQRTEKYHFSRLYEALTNVYWLDEVSAYDLEQFQTKLTNERKLSGSTVNRMFNTYHAFFNKCADWGLIAKSPSERIEDLPERSEKRKLWTPEQMQGLIDQMPEWAADVLYFLAETGARPTEACNLTFGDAQLDRGVIIARSYKGAKGLRTRPLHMSDGIRAMIEKRKTKAAKKFKARPSDLVFLNSKGNPVTANTLAKVVRETRADEGLVPYGLRHTFISELVSRDYSTQKIMVLAGHSKSQMTERYVQVKEDQLREMMVESSKSRRLVR